MMFQLRWTGRNVAQAESAATATDALNKYVDLLGTGLARVEIRNDANEVISFEELLRLRLLEHGTPPCDPKATRASPTENG